MITITVSISSRLNLASCLCISLYFVFVPRFEDCFCFSFQIIIIIEFVRLSKHVSSTGAEVSGENRLVMKIDIIVLLLPANEFSCVFFE